MLTSMREKTLTKLLTFVFFTLGLIGILRHEMWFDELQAWLIARDSTSLIDLSRNVRYEGQPGLWHLCLFVISRFTQNPVSMQFLHLGIATLSIYLFLKYSPFSKIQKILFTFSYFPFYEYALISRGYGLGVLFIFVFCILFSKQNKSYLGLFIVVVILANTNVIAFVLAVALLATLAFEYLKTGKPILNLANKQSIITGILVCGFTVAAIYQLLPPPDRSYGQINLEASSIVSRISNLVRTNTNSAALGESIDKATELLKLVWKSFVPIPNLAEYHYWGRNIIEELPSSLRSGIGLVTVAMIAYLLVLFCNYPTVLFLFGFGMSLLLAVMVAVPAASKVRHLGYLFILCIACFWLFNNYSSSRQGKEFKLSTIARKYKGSFLNVILSLQVFAGVYSYAKDFYLPFSVSKTVAKYIQNNQLDGLTIIGSPDFPVASLSAYLKQPIYYPSSNRFGTYVIYDKQRNEEIGFTKALVDRIEEIQNKKQEDVLLVFTQEMNAFFVQEITSNKLVPVEKLASFGRSIVYPERYYHLYLVKFRGGDDNLRKTSMQSR